MRIPLIKASTNYFQAPQVPCACVPLRPSLCLYIYIYIYIFHTKSMFLMLFTELSLNNRSVEMLLSPRANCNLCIRLQSLCVELNSFCTYFSILNATSIICSSCFYDEEENNLLVRYAALALLKPKVPSTRNATYLVDSVC